jgi:hypothetical protein
MGPDSKTRTNDEHAIKLEALRSDIAIARERARRGELVETTAEAFLTRRPSRTASTKQAG